jgi:hypothetical protein
VCPAFLFDDREPGFMRKAGIYPGVKGGDEPDYFTSMHHSNQEHPFRGHLRRRDFLTSIITKCGPEKEVVQLLERARSDRETK